MNEDELIALLGRVDQDDARAAVRAAASECRKRAPFNRDGVLAVLDVLAGAKGLLAASARFAKARVLLAPDAVTLPRV